MPALIDRDAILARLKAIVPNRVPVEAEALTSDAVLAEIGLDSFALIELVFIAEEEFGIKIPLEGLDVRTIGDVIDVIQTQQRKV